MPNTILHIRKPVLHIILKDNLKSIDDSKDNDFYG